jgi:membrane protease YdiL (CAAX protease family)
MTQSLHSLTARLRTLVVVAVLVTPFGGWMLPGDGTRPQLEREAVFWLLAGLVIAYVLVVERRPLASIGLRPPTWRSAVYGVLGAVVALGGIVAIYLVVYPLLGQSANEPGLRAAEAMPAWLNALIVLRAAVFEEIVYRGFILERLAELTGVRWLGALLSLIAFTLAHLTSWGWAHLLVAGYGGLVLTGLYLWRRDLATTMIAHALTDGIGFLLA